MCALCVYFQSVFENSCVPTRFIHVHRPSTCPSRRTTLNLPWIRARTGRGRTGQFSIQVGQSRSSVPCTRLTLIFPISRHLRSHRYSNRFFARGEIVYRLENPKSIHRFQMWNTWLVTAQQVARLLLSSKIIFTRLFSFFFFFPLPIFARWKVSFQYSFQQMRVCFSFDSSSTHTTMEYLITISSEILSSRR